MRIKNAFCALVALLLLINQNFIFAVSAQEFTVSGNGEGSSSSISYQAENNNQIHQENNAEVENDVKAEAETGSNEANDNSGEVQIETGNAQVSTEIVNSGNTSTAVIDCCPAEDPGSVVVADNGEDSQNSVEITQDSATNITTVNKLNLDNNVDITANTGDNEADDNSGDVTIKTGEVNILAQILNKNLNNSYISASSANNLFNYKIAGNGANSVNTVTESGSEDNNYLVFNDLYLNNSIINNANTGGNKANKNNGKVFIATGSVLLDIILLNKDINTSVIKASCCSSPSPTPTPTPTPSPSGTPGPSESPSPSNPPQGSCCSPTTDIPGPGGGGGGGGSSSSSSGGGEVLGAALPATGGFSLWMLTVLALLMLSAGVILRGDYEYAQDKFKKVSGKFADSFGAYLFGAYLLAYTADLPSRKFRSYS